MNAASPGRGSRKTSGRRPPENSPEIGRSAPRLLVDLTLEELPRVSVDADTFEEQVRVIAWATHPATIQRLRDALADTLDELCEAA